MQQSVKSPVHYIVMNLSWISVMLYTTRLREVKTAREVLPEEGRDTLNSTIRSINQLEQNFVP